MMRRFAAGIALTISGCFQIDQAVIVNPDGAAKIEVHMVTPMNPFDMDTGPIEERARREIAGFIGKSRGIDAWRDVRFLADDDGRIDFSGVAYVSNLNNMRLHNVDLFRFTFGTADGLATLMLESDKSIETAPPDPPSDDSEVQSRIKQERAEYRRDRTFLVGIFSEVEFRATLLFPGDIIEICNLTPEENRRATFAFTGLKLIEAMDAIIADDDFAATQIRAGRKIFDKTPAFHARMNAELYGDSRAISVTFKTGSPQFDFAKELAAAKIEHRKLLERLGI